MKKARPISILLVLLSLPASQPLSDGVTLFAQTKSNSSACEALLAAMKGQLNAKSYRLREVQTGLGKGVGVNVITSGNYVAPDKFQATVETDLGRGGKGEMLLIGGMAYVKTPEGVWQSKPTDLQRIELEFARLRQTMLIDKLTNARCGDVKLAGQEAIGGATMNVYEYSFAGPPKTAIRFQTRVWVGVTDRLPRRIEVEALTSHKGLKFTFKTTTSYFDYNADIVIDSPT